MTSADAKTLSKSAPRTKRSIMRKILLPIDQICLDFQRPEALFEDRVEYYMSRMLHGAKIKPIAVCFDGTRYLLKDGFHRVEAAHRLGRQRLDARVTLGTLEEMEVVDAELSVKRDAARNIIVEVEAMKDGA